MVIPEGGRQVAWSSTSAKRGCPFGEEKYCKVNYHLIINASGNGKNLW